MKIPGRRILQVNEKYVELEVGAGEEWHAIVLWTIENGWGGLENLSLIPGLCGAAPMQNIGAYGVEIKDFLTWVEVLDRESLSIRKLNAKECKLGYRDSIFKNELKNKVIITKIGIQLTKEDHYQLNTSYGAIEEELKFLKIDNPTIHNVSRAVINIRESKLPNPKLLPNNGSFFKNPIIQHSDFVDLYRRFPDMPHYSMDNAEIKIPAGWLIDNAGLKGKRSGGVGTHINQALVIVNHDRASGKEVIQFARFIQKKVQDLYGIQITPEVNIYPS